MHTLIKETQSSHSMPHDHHHAIHVLCLQMTTSRYPLLPLPTSTTCRTRARNLLRTTLRNARWSSQYEQQFIIVPRLPKSLVNTKVGNLLGSIRMSHNSHTRTGNTRQSEPQLKECLCPSVILSHNSRDVIPSHNSRNSTCLPYISSHNSRDTNPGHNSRNATTKFILKVSLKALQTMHIQITQTIT